MRWPSRHVNGGAALAVGGTSGFGRLAPELAALAVPVVVNGPIRDDSDAGRNRERDGSLLAALRGRVAVASLAAESPMAHTRPGCDPDPSTLETRKAPDDLDNRPSRGHGGNWWKRAAKAGRRIGRHAKLRGDLTATMDPGARTGRD